MATSTIDLYGNAEIIFHKENSPQHLCTKCKLTDMKPTFFHIRQSVSFNRGIENINNYVRGDSYYDQDEVRKEHIVWK